MTTEQLKAERMLLGDKLARELEHLAELCRRTGLGEHQARRKLECCIDGHWHALCVGAGKVQLLCADEEWEVDNAEGR